MYRISIVVAAASLAWIAQFELLVYYSSVRARGSKKRVIYARAHIYENIERETRVLHTHSEIYTYHAWVSRISR